MFFPSISAIPGCVLLKLSFSVKHLFKGLIEVVANG